jgi:hypothetical protein
VLASGACQRLVEGDVSAEATGAGGSEDSSTATTTSGTTTTGTATTSTTNASTSASTSDDSGTSNAFVTIPDAGPTFACDPWVQDCGADQKCAWVNKSGGYGHDGTSCVPLDPDANGSWQPCTIFGEPWEGLDDCASGHWCGLVPPGETSGLCLPYCDAQEQCPDPAGFCPPTGAASVICYPKCDPLDPGSCADPARCGTVSLGWVCLIPFGDESGGYLDECELDDDCLDLLVCVDAVDAPGCTAARCCQALCDSTGPNTCPDAGAGQICQAYPFSEPDWDHVGKCEIP